MAVWTGGRALWSRAVGNILRWRMRGREARIVRVVVCGITVVGLVIGLSLLRDQLRRGACEDEGGRWNPMDTRCEMPPGQ